MLFFKEFFLNFLKDFFLIFLKKITIGLWFLDTDKAFRLASTLSRHRDIHSDRKRFVCGDCGASFRQSAGLNYHQSRHHSRSVVRPCSVENSGKKFTVISGRFTSENQPAGDTDAYPRPVKLSRSCTDPKTGLKSVQILSRTGVTCIEHVKKITNEKNIRVHSSAVRIWPVQALEKRFQVQITVNLGKTFEPRKARLKVRNHWPYKAPYLPK